MKILIAVDGSPYTAKAVNHIASNLKWFKGTPELHLLHVQPPLPGGTFVNRVQSMKGSMNVDDHYQEEAQAVLSPVADFLDERSIPFEGAYVVSRDTASEITRYAKEQKIDLIVMGSHGHGALAGIVMGSVTQKVIAEFSVPVMILR